MPDEPAARPPHRTFDRRAFAGTILGTTVPVLAGLALGRLELGLAIGLGSLLMGGRATGHGRAGIAAIARHMVLSPALFAVLVATRIGGAPWSDAAMIAIAALAATLIGYSRPAAEGALRFIVYLVLSLGLMESGGAHAAAAPLAFGLGALWRHLVRALLAERARQPAPETAPPARTPTPAQRRRHWLRTLRGLAGWQFAIRLAASLAVASIVRHAWPSHHYAWVLLTVALLTPHTIERFPLRILERTIGTSIGVAATWGILLAAPSYPVIALLVCVLAAIAPFARDRSYLAWSALATPLILLAMDLGKPVEPALLVDRLVATAIGSAIVLAANLAFGRLLRAARPAERPAPATQ